MMPKKIIVVGAANVDITATPTSTYRPYDSNPSHVEITFGGVGRNIGHNLRLLGHEVSLLTMWGDDAIAHALLEDCRHLGLMVLSQRRIAGARSNYFICITDHHGEMQAGAADLALMDNLTPDVIDAHLTTINSADAVVADCNASAESLLHLATNCTKPLYVDGTSSVKASKIAFMLQADRHAPIIVKVNHAEAQELTGSDNVETMATNLITMGAARAYITMGSKGAYCHDGKQGILIPTQEVEPVNVTGAGDAFMAAVIHAEISGHDMATAAQLGITAASATLQSKHAVNPLLQEIINNTTHQ